MAVFNSQIDPFEDESDFSVINPSMNDEYVDNTYVPIITRLKQANHSSENRQITNSQLNNTDKSNDQPKCPSGVEKHDYIFVGHDPLESAKNLEQTLIFYIRDLKQESNTQLDCDKQLVTRLMDLIRPAYLNDREKMIQLDKIVEDIGVLHDKRHIDQKDKFEQLRADRNRLQRMMFPTDDEQAIYNDPTKNYSMFSTLQHQGHSSTDYEQWTEIEDDAKKLHELVELQRNQINEIVSLISQTVEAPPSIDPPQALAQNIDDTLSNKQVSSTTNKTILDLFKKVQDIARLSPSQKPQPPISTVQAPTTTLINHSPGISPTQSLNTLTLSTMHETMVEPETEEPKTLLKPEEPKIELKQEEPVDEKAHEPIDIPITPPIATPPIEAKKCPVCSHEFPPTCDDVEMYDHIEKCLFPSGAAVEPKDYECPICNRKFPGNDDSSYLQHLSDCYNQGF